ncbi:MAG: SBBP repeat-containing protein [Cyclobacteriaceae bacterium]|nr:SBBP repeat-containing protein [Cyclobacteriaceae bacterium]
MKKLPLSLLAGLAFCLADIPTAVSQDFNWIKQISGTGPDYLEDMVTDANGNIYATGFFGGGTIDLDPGPGVTSFGPANGTDIWLAKYTSTGENLNKREREMS